MRSSIRLGGRHTNVLCTGLSLGAALVLDDAANFSRCGVICRCARRGSGCTNDHGLHTVVQDDLRCGGLDHSGFDLSGRSRSFWSRCISSHRSRSLRGRSFNRRGRSLNRRGRSLNSWSFWGRSRRGRCISGRGSRSRSRRGRGRRFRSRSVSRRGRRLDSGRFTCWGRSIIASWRWGSGRFTDFASGRRIGVATIYLVTGIDLITNDHCIGSRSWNGRIVNSRSGSVVNSRSGSVGSWFVTRLGVCISSVSVGITCSVSGVSGVSIASVRITNNRSRSIASRSFFHWATIGINDNRPVERCGGSISSVGVNVNVNVKVTSYIASVISTRSVCNITIRGIGCNSVADHRNITGRLFGAWATIGLGANNDNGPIHAFDFTVCIYSITLGVRIGSVRTSLVAAWKITYNYVAVDYLYWATVRTKWHIAVHSSHFTISGRWFTVGGRIGGVSGISLRIFVGLAFDAWRSRSLVCFDKAHRQGEHRVDSANI